MCLKGVTVMIPKLKTVSLMTPVLKLLEALEQEGYIDLKDENFRETPRRVGFSDERDVET